MGSRLENWQWGWLTKMRVGIQILMTACRLMAGLIVFGDAVHVVPGRSHSHSGRRCVGAGDSCTGPRASAHCHAVEQAAWCACLSIIHLFLPLAHGDIRRDHRAAADAMHAHILCHAPNGQAIDFKPCMRLRMRTSSSPAPHPLLSNPAASLAITGLAGPLEALLRHAIFRLPAPGCMHR